MSITRKCFAPVANAEARVLILGSMPGQRSLDHRQYYALPQNAFWRIIDELLGMEPEASYAERLDALRAHGIALWDVLASCERETSLDAHIRAEVANDFSRFFARHPRITQVLFNGGKAEQSFMRLVHRRQKLPPLELHRLPSTSPAHAGMRYEEKLQRWREALLHAKVKVSVR